MDLKQADFLINVGYSEWYVRRMFKELPLSISLITDDSNVIYSVELVEKLEEAKYSKSFHHRYKEISWNWL